MNRRLVSAALGGTLAGISLFWLMPQLIGDTFAACLDCGRPVVLDLPRTVMPSRATERPPAKREKPEPPRDPGKPPPVPTLEIEDPATPGSTTVRIAPTPPDSPEIGGRPALIDGPIGVDPGTERALVVVTAVEPVYPASRLRDGVEGWVEIEFIVTATGTVRDPQIVDAAPHDADFERAALRAINRWKFQPRIVDGRPLEQRARQRIAFKLERD
jgi:protein TonB